MFPLLDENNAHMDRADALIESVGKNERQQVQEEQQPSLIKVNETLPVSSDQQLPDDSKHNQTTNSAITNQHTSTETQQAPLVYNPTINQQIRNRMLFRDAQGVNFGKLYAKQIFAPPAITNAKDTISGHGKDYIISRNPYEVTAVTSLEESMDTKSRFVAGSDFKKSYIHNNGVYSDKAGVSERASRATLHTTGDKFQTEINDYKLFLAE